jgi:hypothetical protein
LWRRDTDQGPLQHKNTGFVEGEQEAMQLKGKGLWRGGKNHCCAADGGGAG